MLNENVMQAAQSLINAIGHDKDKRVKRIRQDKGLIERMDSDKIILAEDNRQLLFS